MYINHPHLTKINGQILVENTRPKVVAVLKID